MLQLCLPTVLPADACLQSMQSCTRSDPFPEEAEAKSLLLPLAELLSAPVLLPSPLLLLLQPAVLLSYTCTCSHPFPEEAEAELLLPPLAELLSVPVLLPPLLLLLLALLLPEVLLPEVLLEAGGGDAAVTGEGDDRPPDDILLHVEKMVAGLMKLLNPFSEPELHRQQTSLLVLSIRCDRV